MQDKVDELYKLSDERVSLHALGNSANKSGIIIKNSDFRTFWTSFVYEGRKSELAPCALAHFLKKHASIRFKR